MKFDIVLSSTCEYAAKKALDGLVKRARGSDEEFIVLAPETKTLFVERYLLNAVETHAFSNIFVYSFNRLLKRLQTKTYYPLSKEAGVMIIRHLIMELEGSLVCYKKTASTVGFAENIYETLQQLKSSGISPIELSEAAKKCKTALRIKLEDIALLYDAYENYIGENLVDASDKLVMLENQIAVSDRIKNAHLFVVGFDSLTSNAAGVIKQIAKTAKSLTVSAPFMHPDNKNAHISDNEVYEKYKAVAEELNIKYEPQFVPAPLKGDFKHIYESLYAYPTQVQKECGNLELYEYPSIEVEAKSIASQIKSSCLKGETRYKDNCIYLANEDVKKELEKQLEDFEISYFSAKPYDMESHPLFGFVKNLFLIIRRKFERADVLAFSRSVFLGLNNDDLDDFENYTVKFGINHSRFLKPFSIDDQLLGAAEKVRAEIMRVVTAFSAGNNENLSISELVDALFAFFDWFGLKNKLENLQNMQDQNGDLRAAKATEQAYQKLEEVLKRLSQFLGNNHLKLDELYTLLVSGLEAADISLLPLSVDNVQIVTSADGLMDIKNLYIAGAVDGCFPKHENDLGLIQDADIASIEEINQKKIEPTIRTINRRERYKVFELLLLPTNRLIISSAIRGLGAEENKCSSLVTMLAGLFKDAGGAEKEIKFISSPFEAAESSNDFVQLVYALGTRRVAKNYLVEILSAYKAGVDYPIDKEIVDSLYMALRRDVEGEFIKSIDQAGGQDEYIKNAKQLYFPKKTTSISQLERYFSCPFQHFADYGLRLKERVESSMRALDVGDILHSLAEMFVRHLKTHQQVDTDKFAINALEKILAEKKYNEENNRILINILKDEAKRLIQGIYLEIQASGFKPLAVEKWFGGADHTGIDIGNGISIVGKIDRIDVWGDYYRLIDYKTGKIEASAEDIYYGHKLQLAIYLSAMSELKKNPAGVLYYPVRNEFADGKDKADYAYRMQGYVLKDDQTLASMDMSVNELNLKSKFVPIEAKVVGGAVVYKDSKQLLSQAEIESMASYARAVSANAVKEILGGYIKPAPYKKGEKLPCNYCKLKNVCGIVERDYNSQRSAQLANADKFYKGGKLWQM